MYAVILSFIFLPNSGNAGHFGEKSEPIAVYCSSAELEAGFTDERGEEMCRGLKKYGRKKKSVRLVEKDEAQVILMFLGVTDERVAEPAGQKFQPYAGFVYQPDKKERTVKALLTVGDFEKEFTLTSTGGAIANGLGYEIEEWIRENREAILSKVR